MSVREFEWYVLFGFQIPAIENTGYLTNLTKESSVQVLLKDNKAVSCFSQTQRYILFYIYLDDMFRSVDHHRAIFTKYRIRWM